jgi:hypothetical protein
MRPKKSRTGKNEINCKYSLAILKIRPYSGLAMQTINHDTFATLLRTRLGAIILGLETVTTPKARKGAPPLLEKISKGAALVGGSYGRAVEKQSGQTFAPDALPWGEWAIPHKVIRHGGALYLRTIARNQKPMASHFISAGEPIEKEKVVPFLATPAPSAKQETVGLHGKRQVRVRTIKFDNIKTIKIKGETYRLVP